MAKAKAVFICQSCGANSPKWIGKCPSCNEWNTYVEEIVTPQPKEVSRASTKNSQPQLLEQVELSEQNRLVTHDNELNRVLGGGIVPGSLVLIGGEPGIGKSTLMLQLALSLSGKKILYVSGEESEQQIRMRAGRVDMKNASCYVLTETTLQVIFKHLENIEPDILIIDSIQTLYSTLIESAPGSVSQIRGCAGELLRYAKEENVPVFLIGHITKDGVIAGPKVLEHMVDTVLQFEGDRHHVYRLLRSSKNRFGSTSELGIYEMHGNGLKEVTDPGEILISQRNAELSGIAIACNLEGMRTMLIETQALVSSAVYGTPQRSATGFDIRRLNMLLAVLEKRCGFRLGAKDVFLNITGGIRVEDPAIDLAVTCAILSSNSDLAIPPQTCFAGEVGLSGEIRPVSRIEQRIKEAEKLGFKKFFYPSFNESSINKKSFSNIELAAVAKIEDVFQLLFG
ncbi:MAG TPA: DNA repair protein RadA [Bacteroidia bacterium]|nr:DNA repair protein RadA [Bacteroidia bacterium]HNU32588.1 DNA repair protein RadA [Bacteroidia bacterium]